MIHRFGASCLHKRMVRRVSRTKAVRSFLLKCAELPFVHSTEPSQTLSFQRFAARTAPPSSASASGFFRVHDELLECRGSSFGGFELPKASYRTRRRSCNWLPKRPPWTRRCRRRRVGRGCRRTNGRTTWTKSWRIERAASRCCSVAALPTYSDAASALVSHACISCKSTDSATNAWPSASTPR